MNWYGKFGLVNPIGDELAKSIDLQPAIQESQKVLTPKPTRTVIQRTRHGQHPAGSVSAHINYKTLNKVLGHNHRIKTLREFYWNTNSSIRM